MIIAPTKVNLGLVHNIKLDLSALLIGSTSSDNGYSLRRGFQVTYLFGENSENRVFFPFFLKVDQALSQSVDDVSPSSLPRLSGEPREQRGASARAGRRAKNLPLLTATAGAGGATRQGAASPGVPRLLAIWGRHGLPCPHQLGDTMAAPCPTFAYEVLKPRQRNDGTSIC